MNWFQKTCSLGECFRTNAKWAMENDAEIVHGEVTNISGNRFPHCWAEKDGKVYDQTTGLEGMDAQHFYEITKAKITARYSWEEAAIKMIRQKHWGPWD